MSGETVLEVRGLTKSFGGQQALCGVDFELRAGQIHALLGANGAGKSTLIRILAGLERPDRGTIEVLGHEHDRTVLSPQMMADVGMRFVHQHLGLIESMSVAENIALGTGYEHRRHLLALRQTETRVGHRLEELGFRLDPGAILSTLAPAERVLVAVARALFDDAPIVVLDEVTASLPSPEITRLGKDLRRVRDQGAALVFVTHRIEEVFALADTITVLAEGRRVAHSPVVDVDHEKIVRWIVGGQMRPGSAPAPARGCPDDRVVLEGRGLAERAAATEEVSLQLRAGEVLGLTGLVGSGFDRIARWLAGVEAPERGVVLLHGEPVRVGDAIAFRRRGCEFVTGDRTESAFLDLTVLENIFPGRDGVARRLRRRGHERRTAAALLDHFDVRPTNSGPSDLQHLSGGNQQKVLLARALRIQPTVLVLVDPTAGVDIGARAMIHRYIRDATAAGTGVLLASSDFEEVAAHSSRALVVRGGALAAEFDGPGLNVDNLTRTAHRPEGAMA